MKLAAKLVVTFVVSIMAYTAHAECVRVYYDAPYPSYHEGEVYSYFLQNLLGHFDDLTVIAKPIETYQRGELDQCRASFYIGSYFGNAIPQSFLDDFSTTTKSVAWLGYSLEALGPERLLSSLGVERLGLTALDTKARDKYNRPTFFKNILYKGQIFEKFGEYSDDTQTSFQAAFEITGLRVLNPQTRVLAEALHNGVKQRLPYAVQASKRFYIADIPFSYIHESDRYLVFADLLFDILNEAPKRTKKLAVLRLEDVHAKVASTSVIRSVEIAKSLGVTPHIALIPVFTDPLGTITNPPQKNWVAISQDSQFKATLQKIQNEGARFIWHGVTHQYDSNRNPSGTVGDDWEFWDINRGQPIADDSPSFIIKRLNSGWQSMEQVGIRPKIWEVPHYQASTSDYLIFAKLFSWNIGRIEYRPFVARGLPASNSNLWFERNGSAGLQFRLKAFGEFHVEAGAESGGQFFPYEIYRDVYGQRVLPENLGNPQQDEGLPPRQTRTIDTILKDARRNLVLRDVWASFFFHPYLLETKTGEADLRRALTGLKAMGYEFVDLESFIQPNARAQRNSRRASKANPSAFPQKEN